MDYQLFKQLVPQRIKEFLPPVFHSYEVSVRQVPKVNCVKDAICLIPPERKTNIALPTLYLDDLYEEFARDEDLDVILAMAAEVFLRWSGMELPDLATFRLEDHTDRIIANLVNTRLNQALADKVPHTEFLDMTVIYRLVHSLNEDGINSAIITNEMLESSGLTGEDLHTYAIENTPRLFPARLIDTMGSGICVMTNEAGVCGATTMLYPQELQRLAQRIGGDYFIVPTSIHEFFAVPSGQTDPCHLARVLAEGNGTITSQEDMLSGMIYQYLAKEDRLRPAVA